MPPIFVLVKPQMGENIGATARAMHNFGIKELRIVAPRDGWPNPKALDMAANAKEITEKAEIFDDLESAIADCQYVLATSARRRDINKPGYAPEQATQQQKGKTAILFGPERSGLTNEDVALADALIHIPVSPDNPSLNIAQAAVIIAYNWFQAEVIENIEEMQDLADKEALHGMFDHLEQSLDKSGFFKTNELKSTMWRNIRAMFQRAELSPQEVQTLRGIISALTR
jgi:tRNA/rRNA methyltransferase